MLNELPIDINPTQLVAQRARLKGELLVANMPRLLGYLANNEGEVAIDLKFGQDEQKLNNITGSVKAQINVTCERCLAIMPLELNASIKLGMVMDEAAIEKLPEDYEPLLITDEAVSLSDLVEDELILSLPFVIRHDDSSLSSGDCQPLLKEHSVGIKAPDYSN